MKKCIVTLVIMVFLLLGANGFAASNHKEDLALAAAGNWLSLIDQKMYKEAWRDSAVLMRSAILPQQLGLTMKNTRGGFGKVLSRTIKEQVFKTSLPGAPDGHYFVILFNTNFEHKKNAIETVTPMLGSDGKWRVSGYYIK